LTLYRDALRALPQGTEPALELELWTKLGDLSLHKLDQRDTAIAAYEVVTSLEPDDLQRREQLLELYLQEGDSRRGDAIEELQVLLSRQPDRPAVYRLLADLYRAEGNVDGAFLAASALAFLEMADPEDAEVLALGDNAGLPLGRSRLTTESWLKELSHHAEDRHLQAAFARAMSQFGLAVAQPLAAFGLDPKTRVDLATDHRAPARVVQYAVDLLGFERAPALYIDEEEGGGVRIASILENGQLAPALIVGLPWSLEQDERLLSFEIGRALSYLRPERLCLAAFPTLPGLKSALESMTGQGKWTPLLQKGLGTAGLEELRELIGGGDAQTLLVRVTAFRDAADHTASRAGLLLCGDLQVAATALTRSHGALTTLPVRDRLRELLAFSVSLAHLKLRRHVGLALENGALADTGYRPSQQ
jgi:hypothetical protein